MKEIKSKDGITLIALVITIIILVILAGVAVGTLKDTNMFDKAKSVASKYNEKAEEENTAIDTLENTLNEYAAGPTKKITNIDKTETDPEKAMPSNVKEIIESDANKGIVIKDSKDNEWVWVEVPMSITKDATTDAAIETALKTYVGDYTKGKSTQDCNWKDEYYDGCGMTESEYNTAKSKMLQSIKSNGGFWISRYEAGIKGSDTDTSLARYTHTDITSSSPEAVSQANMIPYNFVTRSEAQTLAKMMSTDSTKTSSLLFGIQWDLICKFLEVKTSLTYADIATDSRSWGNYHNSSLLLSRGKYNIYPYGTGASAWTPYNTPTENYVTADYHTSNNDSYYQLLTTGASDDTKKMNIYDLAGNEEEWSLEHATDTFQNRYPLAARGGDYNANPNTAWVDATAERSSYSNNDSYASTSMSDIGFRSALY